MNRLARIVRRAAYMLSRALPEPLVLRLRQRRYLAVLRAGLQDEPELTAVAAMVRPGDFCVDIGANFGLYTAAMSRLVGPAGTVVSIEPMPQTYAMLAANVRALGLTNVRPIHAAVTDADGDVRMALPRWEYGAPNFYQARIASASDAVAVHRVPGMRLDTILGPTADVAFIKCDVEGHELAVLRGAAVTLGRSPALLVEVSGDPDAAGSSAADVLALLAGLGYTPYRLTGGTLTPRQAGDRDINYFFLKPEHLERLRHAGAVA